jgi:uncharacterized protein YcaQ
LSEKALSISLEIARRLAVTKQHLAGDRPKGPPRDAIHTVVRDLACVQWDPITIVAPSHVISLWSRIGDFQLADLETLLWDEKRLFLTWSPIASIVPIEDYPVHHSLMTRYPDSLSNSWGSQRERARRFLAEHQTLRKAMLSELKKGPLLLNQFSDYVRSKRREDGWTSGSEVSSMLSHLLMTGDVMVVGHEGNRNVWGLSDEFLPSWAERGDLSEQEVEAAAAQRAIRALGTASAREINYYFVRGRYLNLKRILQALQEESAIHRVRVQGIDSDDERYVHDEDLPLVDSLDTDAWRPRMSLVAPFDNLICGRDRTNRVFGFDYVHEQFLPKNKRKYGTYVLPLLWGDRLVGRVDLRLDREHERLLVNSAHAEPSATREKGIASEIRETLTRFAGFLGASEVTYSSRVPIAWKSALR